MSEVIKKISPEYKEMIEQINGKDFSGFSDDEIKSYSLNLRERVEKYCTESQQNDFNQRTEFLTEAFALVKEAVYRKLDIRVYDEQLWTGMVLNDNAVAQMATGEGKTIAAVFSAFLNSLDYGAVHIFTFNDYLAKRDATTMKPIYNMLGISVDYLYSGQDFDERKKAYSCDVTYMTVKECGFDYLKEFLAESPDELIQPDFNYAIVDEADSILIDEARIPLVMAAKTDQSHKIDLFRVYEAVEKLDKDVDFEIDDYGNNIFLTENGIEKLEKILETENLYDDKNMDLIVSVNNALFAKELLKRDVDYIVKENKIELVDEFTGRIADKRHWPHGLHEAIEAKERIDPSKKGQILGQITLQNFMKIYPRLAGMTGTAESAAKEFDNTYDLKVHIIPTHHPMIRVDHPNRIFVDKETKMHHIIKEIEKAHSSRRPVLIGTSSVTESESLSKSLEDKGIECRVLNAKNNAREAQLISNAGCSGTVTVSTNMAGRGIDIKLGGEDPADHERVVSLGGLLIIGTNLHESVRVDNQLRGRAGRQGDPGESKFFISIEDDIFIKYKFKDLIPDRHLKKHTDGLFESPKVLKEAARLQKIVEGSHYDIRDSLMKYTVMIQEQSEYIRNMRLEIFHLSNDESYMLKESFPDKYADLRSLYDPIFIHEQEKLLALRTINQSWADYLENMSYVKDSIHILKMSGMDPLFEYNKILFESFEELKENIRLKTQEYMETARFNENGFMLEQIGLKKPESIRTYVVSSTADQLNLFPFLESLTKIAKKRW